MKNLKIYFETTSYGVFDNFDEEKLKKDFEEFIKEKYGKETKYSKLSVTHVDSNTCTPDGKFKIGNVYKLSIECTENYTKSLTGLLGYIAENEKGSLHLGFYPVDITNPTPLEIDLGFTNKDNKELVDGLLVSKDFIGYNWKDNNLYSYRYPGDMPIKAELVKEVDDKAFTDFYIKVNNR